jgi:hypothetical protein
VADFCAQREPNRCCLISCSPLVIADIVTQRKAPHRCEQDPLPFRFCFGFDYGVLPKSSDCIFQQHVGLPSWGICTGLHLKCRLVGQSSKHNLNTGKLPTRHFGLGRLWLCLYLATPHLGRWIRCSCHNPVNTYTDKMQANPRIQLLCAHPAIPQCAVYQLVR